LETFNKKIIIAIDGHSSTGKSTVAKEVAKHFGYTYIDTGAMYRSVSLFALEQGFISNAIIDKKLLIENLDKIHIAFKISPETNTIATFLNHKNVEKKIRSLEVSSYVSHIASISEVRKLLVDQQQLMGKQKGVVMDGRDIGTVVFPDAELKLFMTASAAVRATRRFEELKAIGGEKVSYQEVLKNVEERDFIDSNRKDSPLIKAADAHLIDNSTLSRTEQFQVIVTLVERAVAEG